MAKHNSNPWPPAEARQQPPKQQRHSRGVKSDDLNQELQTRYGDMIRRLTLAAQSKSIETNHNTTNETNRQRHINMGK
jgi:hypothetical protein